MPDWIARMADIQERCQQENWDSYDADPVTDRALLSARKIIGSVDVVPTVNGGISVEWLSEGLCIEVGADGEVSDMSFHLGDSAARLRGLLHIHDLAL